LYGVPKASATVAASSKQVVVAWNVMHNVQQHESEVEDDGKQCEEHRRSRRPVDPETLCE
jgi:uncharacterized protein YeaC (DUF1315 family)